MKKHILCLETGKELLEWFATNSCSSGKNDEFHKLYDSSSKQVCLRKNPIIYITNVIKKRLEDFGVDSSFSDLLVDCFFQGVEDESIDDVLNALDSTIKQASLMEFLNDDYIVVCKNERLKQKLDEQGLNCVLLSEFIYSN